eukprot:GHVT01073760.1.p1 GENE.GHVT01073760.1~~GHVT01073760.1.p1  ORF type:complete len:174 (-),score=31.85 GHVT01073760.1:1811-2332(-)
MHLGQDRPQVLGGCDGVAEAATVGGAEGVVVTGIVGTAGLLPTVAAIEAGKAVALANKETLIAAGPVMQELLRKHKTLLLAADSEHSAILQCLQGTPSRGDIRRLILTASGGAFRSWPKEDLRKATVQDALKHVQKEENCAAYTFPFVNNRYQLLLTSTNSIQLHPTREKNTV